MEKKDIIFGVWPIVEAIKSGKTIEKLLLKKGSYNSISEELKEVIKEHNITISYVPIEKLNSLTRKNHQGVIAFISPIEYYEIEQIIPLVYEKGKVPFVLVLDRITDVRNFGAIVRTAECANIDAIVIPNKEAAQINSDAMKSSAGALSIVPICKSTNLYNSVMYLKDSGLKVVSVTEKAIDSYTNVDYKEPLCLIFGSEEDGISSQLLKISHNLVQIPILGEIESLNVSVASGVAIYEVVSQRLKK